MTRKNKVFRVLDVAAISCLFLLLLLPSSTNAWLSTTRLPPRQQMLHSGQTISGSSIGSGRMRMITPPLGAVRIREWETEDGIYDFLTKVLPLGVFDPEGPLETDCATAMQRQESYPIEDGCCFMCAVDASERIIGTAGLVVGTQVAYMTSGSSLASYVTTGAICRVAVDPTIADTSVQESILEDLLTEVERRAQQQTALPSTEEDGEAVNRLIALAYRDTSCRPTAPLLEKLGYEELDTPFGDVVQYQKTFSNEGECNITIEKSTGAVSDNSKSQEETNGNIIVATTGASVLFFLAALWAIIHGMGFDASMSSSTSINGGIGTPLTTQELGRLIQDETLKRTSLGDESSSPEEDLREDAAMIKIITGQDVRMQ